MLSLCNVNAVCIWLGTKCDEWGCVWVSEWKNEGVNDWMNEWMDYQLYFSCDKCDVWVFLFQEIILAGMIGVNDCVIDFISVFKWLTNWVKLIV